MPCWPGACDKHGTKGHGSGFEDRKSRAHFEIVLAYKMMGFMILSSYTYTIVVYFFIRLLCLPYIPISLMLFIRAHLNT